MANLKRYYLHKGLMYWDSEERREGDNVYVKFADIKEFLNTSTNNGIKDKAKTCDHCGDINTVITWCCRNYSFCPICGRKLLNS